MSIKTWIAKQFPSSVTYAFNGGDFVSVKDFGAKGDGSTDDYTAIQKAIDATKGILYFPLGHI